MRGMAAAGLTACALSGLAGAQESGQRYPIPGQGSLLLSVPAGWRAASRSLEDPASVLLRLRPAAGDGFLIQVSALWLDAAKREGRTPPRLKGEVQKSAEKLLAQSVEKNAVIEELRGAQSFGYYYSLTDRQPKPGEYKYLTQGMVMTGELLTIFTVLHHEPAPPERGQALRMFADATYLAASTAPAAAGR